MKNYSYFIKNNILVIEKGEGLNHQKATAYYFHTKNLKIEKITSNHVKIAGFLLGVDKKRLKRQVTALSDYLWVEFHHRKDRNNKDHMYFNIVDHDVVSHEFIQLNHFVMVVEAIENHFLDKRKYMSSKVKRKYYPYIRKYLAGNKRYFKGNLVTQNIDKLLNGYSESPVGKALVQKKLDQPQDNYAIVPVDNRISTRKTNNQAVYEAECILGYRDRKNGELKVIEQKKPKNEALNKTLSIVDKVDKVIQQMCDIIIPFGKKR
ncbi:hypothetical protein ABC382_01000 [Lysinibacillus sp. 1P01SD]|uniref:hypothetical protein n=1 Tax=Lysinibacillus sp. 1P01SD TaxID=3132285 RepID=UPI0039A111C6